MDTKPVLLHWSDMSTPRWLPHYDAGVPATLEPYPPGTLVDYVDRHVAERPGAAALIFKGRRISWRELDTLSDAFAAALAALGVRRGDRIALLLPNCPQFAIAQFAVWKLGAVVVALNPIYTEHELVPPLANTRARVVVALTKFYGRVKAAQPQTGVELVITTNIKDFLPPVLALLFTLLKEKKEGHRVTLAGNGREAVEAWERESFAAILMDVQMPEMDGYRATGAIRAREQELALRRTPIIGVTAHAMKGDREKCLAAGMDEYVSKPIKSAELREVLERLVPAIALTPPAA